MPAGNIEASAWTRQIGSAGVNQRGPSAPQMRSALVRASSPATLERRAWASWRRAPLVTGSRTDTSVRAASPRDLLEALGRGGQVGGTPARRLVAFGD